MAVLNALLSGGTRTPDDYYPTPVSATRALLPHIADFSRTIWEPCCGTGAISKELKRAGFRTIDHDLRDYGFGQPGLDFIKTNERAADAVITNPPFRDAELFIKHMHKLGVAQMALLLKINYWSAARRIGLFELWRPSKILPLTWRLDFTGAGAPHTDCMWVLWNGRAIKQTTFELLQQSETE